MWAATRFSRRKSHVKMALFERIIDGGEKLE